MNQIIKTKNPFSVGVLVITMGFLVVVAMGMEYFTDIESRLMIAGGSTFILMALIGTYDRFEREEGHSHYLGHSEDAFWNKQDYSKDDITALKTRIPMFMIGTIAGMHMLFLGFAFVVPSSNPLLFYFGFSILIDTVVTVFLLIPTDFPYEDENYFLPFIPLPFFATIGFLGVYYFGDIVMSLFKMASRSPTQLGAVFGVILVVVGVASLIRTEVKKNA